MQALAASCEELRARTGNPPLEKNNRITEYSAQIKSVYQNLNRNSLRNRVK